MRAMPKGALKGVLAALAIFADARATTLQQLSLDDMIRESTGIVRAKVTGSRGALHGQNIYTYYRLEVLETAKRDPALSGNKSGGREIEVAVPGGAVNGIRQVAVGSPELTPGSEYVMFLWTGKSGLTQIIGLSQGLFRVARNASGDIELSRPAANELMIDQSGHRVTDQPAQMHWSQLRARIQVDLDRRNLDQQTREEPRK
jgi:hypothetical protein